MKTVVLILFIFSFLISFSQIKEGSSGKQTFNISKEKPKKDIDPIKKDTSASEEESSGKSLFLISKQDATPPVISITDPVNGFKTTEKQITVTGKVSDESGILSVLANNNEAIVTQDGTFQATVFLAYGSNNIKIKAIDINQNISLSELLIERKTGEITEIQKEIVPVEKTETNPRDISVIVKWNSPDNANYSTSLDIITLSACVETNNTIKEVKLYNNDMLLGNTEFGSPNFRGECKYQLNTKIVLNNGENKIRLYIETNVGFNESEVVIKYDINNSKYYALIIGVDNYNDEGITDLSEPINDAGKLSDILTTSYMFEKDNVFFLKDPTKADIIGTLHQMRKTITENDNLLIFYAGHGFWDEEMQLGYWLPSDAEKDNPVNWLPNTDLTNYLNAIKSKHTLLIADACFSGGIFKTRSAFNTESAIEKLYQLKSRKAMTSGTLKEVPDKSVFIEYLLKRLQENNDKYLTSEQLFSNMRMAVINNGTNVPQYGTIHNTGDEGGDFILIHK
jgi:hypothetical protein